MHEIKQLGKFLAAAAGLIFLMENFPLLFFLTVALIGYVATVRLWPGYQAHAAHTHKEKA